MQNTIKLIARNSIPALVLGIFLINSAISQAQPAASPALPPLTQQVQTVEGITEYKLTNGMRVLLAPDVANDRVTVNVTYLVGSRHEGYGETGMAHLLEHLIFKGTVKTPDPKAEFVKRGFNFNGTTNPDRTNYFATFQSNQDSLDWYLGWQADAMVNSFIARKDLDSEMTVVRNEYERAESNAVQALMVRMAATAYLWHNYGKPTIGARSDIENVDIASLQAFYRRYYRPDNAIVMVAGNFDVPKTLARIASTFGSLAAPATPVPTTYTMDTAQDGERSVVVRRPFASQLLMASYHLPPALHPDTAPLQILNLVLADAPSGRLYKALVETKKAQEVFGFVSTKREAGTLFFGAEFGVNDEAASRQQTLLEIIETVAAMPILQQEFDRAKNKINKEQALAFANAASVANGALEFAVHGDWRGVFASRDRLKAVTLDDVNRVAKNYLLPSNRTVGHLIPTVNPLRAPEPRLPDVAHYMSGINLDANGNTSVVFDYSMRNLQKQVISTPLNQGIQLSILNKPVRGDLVTARLTLKFGSLTSLAGQQTAAKMVGDLLERGTPQYTQQQIQDEWVRLGATPRFSASATGATISLTVKKEHFSEAFGFVIHLLKQANFPEKEFAEMKASWIKTLEGQIQDKTSQARNAYDRYGNPYDKDDVRYAPSLEESLASVKALTRAQVTDFHQQFYGAQQAQVIVVGPLGNADNVAALRTQIASHLETWRAPQVWERVPNPLIAKTPARLVYDTPDQANASVNAQLELPLGELDIERWQFELASQIFGAGPGSRLWVRLREKGGLSYSTGSDLSASRRDIRAVWSMSSDVAPANLKAAESAMREELAQSLKNGFTTEEFNRTRTQWLAQRAQSRSGDPFAVSLIGAVQEFQQDWDLPLKNDALINTLTLEQVNAAWRKYMVPEKLVWAIFADAAKTDMVKSQ